MRNKVALVIGGLRGIGRAIGLDLVNNGFTVYATTREMVTDSGIEHLIPVKMDLRSESEIEDLFLRIEDQHQSLDLLVNNAGIGIFKEFEEVSPQEWENVFMTNVFGVFHCTQKAFPLLRKSGGRIINISSIATERKLPFNSVYAASKHAVRGFGGVLAEEWYKYRIFTTNIHLGATYTDIWKDADGFSPGDMLKVDDVARFVTFIAMTPLHVRLDDMTLTPPKGVL